MHSFYVLSVYQHPFGRQDRLGGLHRASCERPCFQDCPRCWTVWQAARLPSHSSLSYLLEASVWISVNRMTHPLLRHQIEMRSPANDTSRVVPCTLRPDAGQQSDAHVSSTQESTELFN